MNYHELCLVFTNYQKFSNVKTTHDNLWRTHDKLRQLKINLRRVATTSHKSWWALPTLICGAEVANLGDLVRLWVWICPSTVQKQLEAHQTPQMRGYGGGRLTYSSGKSFSKKSCWKTNDDDAYTCFAGIVHTMNALAIFFFLFSLFL